MYKTTQMKIHFSISNIYDMFRIFLMKNYTNHNNNNNNYMRNVQLSRNIYFYFISL